MKKKNKEEKEDFLAVIKLVSGEEIISTVTSCEEDDRTLLLLDNPVMFESVVIRNGGMGAIKVIPWVQAATNTILILDMDKVITMSESKDAKLIAIYDNYIDSEGESENIVDMHTSNGKVKVTDQMGYISSVEDARKKFEQLFKINQGPKET